MFSVKFKINDHEQSHGFVTLMMIWVYIRSVISLQCFSSFPRITLANDGDISCPE